MYTIKFDSKAIEFLEKLEEKIRKRIFSKITKTKSTPFRFFERLSERKEYKLRVGNYRIIADINPNKKEIQIVLIGHRKNIYKK